MTHFKYLKLVPMLMIVGLFGACSTYPGGTTDRFHTTANGAQAYPTPAASPSQRPGMNRQDPRDAQFANRPDPSYPTKA